EVVDEALDEGQADAVAFALGGGEGLEEAVANLGRDARAVVGDVEGAEAGGVVAAQPQRDAAAGAHRLLGVEHAVHQHLAQRVRRSSRETTAAVGPRSASKPWRARSARSLTWPIFRRVP